MKRAPPPPPPDVAPMAGPQMLERVIKRTWRHGSPKVAMPKFSSADLMPQLCAWCHNAYSQESGDYAHTMEAACLLRDEKSKIYSSRAFAGRWRRSGALGLILLQTAKAYCLWVVRGEGGAGAGREGKETSTTSKYLV